jgi:hypothetical protein
MPRGSDAHHRATRRADRDAARWLAASLRAGRPVADAAFDCYLPAELREVSARYWTPLPVVRRAATWLREIEARTVVDLGSGAGKFCVAAALLTRCRFTGLEQRASLVRAAGELVGVFGLGERVSFVHGTLGATTAPVGDAYYVFNPFGEYVFPSGRFADPGVAFTAESRRRDLTAARALLSGAPVGTFVITYNGLGAQFPVGYEQIQALISFAFSPKGIAVKYCAAGTLPRW